MDPLTDKIKKAQKKQQMDPELWKELQLRVYTYPARAGFNDPDLCSDFYLAFYPRLKHLVWNYKDQGSSFSVYLNTTLFFFLKTVARKSRLNLTYEKILTLRMAPEMNCFAAEEANLLKQMETQQQNPPASGNPAVERRWVILLLRYACFITDEDIIRNSHRTAYPVVQLLFFARIIRKKMDKNIYKKKKLQETRNKVYVDLQYNLEKNPPEDALKKKQWEKETNNLKARHKKLNQKICRIKMMPSCRFIAQLLGYPKGTVNACFEKIKKKGTDCLYLKPELSYNTSHETITGYRKSTQERRIQQNAPGS